MQMPTAVKYLFSFTRNKFWLQWALICSSSIVTYFSWVERSAQAAPTNPIPPIPHFSPSLRSPSLPSPLPRSIAAATSTLEDGRQLYEAGRFSDAIAALNNAVQAYQIEGDSLNQALGLSYLSLAYQALGQWQAAQQAIDDSLSLLQSNPASRAEPILWAQAYNNQARLWLITGEFQGALDRWRQAQALYQQAGDEVGVLGSQINQAKALQGLGFYRRSRQLLETIHDSLTTAPDSRIKVSGLHNLGVTWQTVGNLQASQQVLVQSLAIAQQIGDGAAVSTLLLSLGNTAIGLEDPEAALKYFEQAEETAVNPFQTLEAQLNQLSLLVELGQGQAAHALAPQIRRQLADLPPSRFVVYGAVNLAESLMGVGGEERGVGSRGGRGSRGSRGAGGQGDEELRTPNSEFRPGSLDSQDLAELLAVAVRMAQTLKDPQAEAYGLSQLGRIYGETGQRAAAVELTQRSLAISQGIRAADITYQSAWQLGRLFKQQGKRRQAIAAYTTAFDALQLLRGDLIAVSANLQFSFRDRVEPVYRELVTLLLTVDRSSDPEEVTQSDLAQAREVMEAFQLAELDNFFRQACTDVQQVELGQLDPRAAVIYPVVLPDRLAVIVAAPHQPLRYYVFSQSPAEVERTVAGLVRFLNLAYDRTEHLHFSQQLYDWLIRPAEAEQVFDQVDTLVFVMDGVLRSLPVAALHDGERYLIENYQVALSLGLELRQPRSLLKEELRLISGGISEGRQGFSPLPAVEQEVNQITQTIPGSILFNQDFTSAMLANQIDQTSANVIHLATHGQFSSKAEDTFLLTWEDRITVTELNGLLRRRDRIGVDPIELLVLSACSTAAGDNRAVLGLAGIAVRSGVRSTVATLWQVRDQSTAIFMEVFYQQLRRPGVTRAEAVRQAQLALLTDPNYGEPFFWAPFVLVGNWL